MRISPSENANSPSFSGSKSYRALQDGCDGGGGAEKKFFFKTKEILIILAILTEAGPISAD